MDVFNKTLIFTWKGGFIGSFYIYKLNFFLPSRSAPCFFYLIFIYKSKLNFELQDTEKVIKKKKPKGSY